MHLARICPSLPHLVAAAHEVAARARSESGELDRSGQMPEAMVAALAASGLLAAPLSQAAGVHLSTETLLEILTLIGSGNLALGRLYEGHVNAVLLVERFGTVAQRRRVADAVLGQHTLLGVWNTDGPARLTLVPECRLTGGKSFASGAGLVGLALVTANIPRGRQMLLVPMHELAGRIDRARWQPLGMRASMTFDVDFSGVTVGPEARLGGPDDYLAQPWFSAGCIRFAAVQLGGALALLQTVHAHLRTSGRQDDPYQVARFARMRLAVETARLWLARAATVLDQTPADDVQTPIITANMARHAVAEACRLVLELGADSVGLAGMLTPHPMERLIRDLSTYLRQPGPDAALASIGQAALAAAELPW